MGKVHVISICVTQTPGAYNLRKKKKDKKPAYFKVQTEPGAFLNKCDNCSNVLQITGKGT